METIPFTLLPAERSYRGLSVTESAALLRRYIFIEQECVRICAAWLLEAPMYEDKYILGYHLWDHAEHVQWMRERLLELRGGHAEADIAPTLKFALDEVLHARDVTELVAGLYGGVKQPLLQAYRDHLSVADTAANAGEIRILQRMIPDLENHLRWGEDIIKRCPTGHDGAVPWQRYIGDLLLRAGGIHGTLQVPPLPALERPHARMHRRSTELKFDSRIARKPLAKYEERESMPHEQSVKEQFAVFFNELWAVGLLASVIVDSWDAGCPWEFQYDMAHHCWDELRHSQFGAIRLKELGEEPSRVDTFFFDQSQNWPFLHRLVYLTRDLEVFFMKRKSPRVLKYQQEGDGRSMIFADADWSDEINHVRYGTKWSEYFLKDDARTVEDIKEEIRVFIARQQAQAGVSKTDIPF
ncbi:MAG: hypothetical protein WEB62_05565 [Bacteroidota bacterium]